MRILHLEHDSGDLELVREALTAGLPGCLVVDARDREQYVARLQQGGFDVIVSDFTVPGFSGMDALALARQHSPDVPFIFVSGSIGEDQAVGALKAGAADYVIKDRMKRLAPAVVRTIAEASQRRELRAAEHALRRSQQSLEAAQALVHLGSWELDVGSGIGTWSAEMYRLLEVDPAAGPLTYVQFLERVHPKDRQAFRDAETRGIAARQPFNLEYRILTREGGIRWVNARGVPEFDANGKLQRLFGTLLDVTEQKALQEQVLRSQRMENLGLLAAGIAHDFNNILTPMLMAAPLLRGQVNDATSLRLLSTLEKSAERGAALVKQILAFSRGTGGEREPLQPNALLRDVIAIVDETFPRSVDFRHDIQPDLPVIDANLTHLHQVLLNLCVNARDAMPTGGTLRLAASEQELTEAATPAIPDARPGRYVVFEVGDTGTGIPEDVLKKMWAPFFTTKAPDRGTGLGLSTVRGIVASHGGFIDVNTALGKGSTFRVYLPVLARTEAGDARRGDFPRGNGELILVVDDDERVRESTAALLSSHGYRVQSAADGEEGVALLEQKRDGYAAVVSDLHMPRLGGVQLVRRARKLNPSIRILIVSGSSRETDLAPSENPVGLGDAFLLKPFKPDALLRALHRMLQG